MKLHLRVLINSSLIALIFIGCQSKTTQISDLIENGKYAEAQELINQLSPEEKSSPEIKLLTSKAESGILLINATKMMEQKDYDQAYSCLIKADKNVRLNEEGIRLLSETRKLMISGLWLGSSDVTKHKISFKLNALTGSTFDGIAIVQGAMFENPIRGGFFDGNELSATMEFKYRSPITRNYHGIARQIVGYDPGSENFTISGNVSNGTMKISIHEINTVSKWTLKKKKE
jgi:hypothetical protein